MTALPLVSSAPSESRIDDSDAHRDLVVVGDGDYSIAEHDDSSQSEESGAAGEPPNSESSTDTPNKRQKTQGEHVREGMHDLSHGLAQIAAAMSAPQGGTTALETTVSQLNQTMAHQTQVLHRMMELLHNIEERLPRHS